VDEIPHVISTMDTDVGQFSMVALLIRLKAPYETHDNNMERIHISNNDEAGCITNNTITNAYGT